MAPFSSIPIKGDRVVLKAQSCQLMHNNAKFTALRWIGFVKVVGYIVCVGRELVEWVN